MLMSLTKKKIFKRLLSSALILTLVMTIIPNFMSQASSNTYDVSIYKGDKENEKWTYPEKEGKVFAGWYTDDTYSTVYTETTGNAVARFVDAKMLSVKKQLLPSEDGTTVSVRFMTAVDSGKFKKVIFQVEAGDTGRSFTLEERKVYKSVLVDGVADPKEASEVFGTDEAKYFALHSITGIPRSVFNEEFLATPYWVTQDGTKVEGIKSKFTINEAIWGNVKYVFADNSDKLVVQKTGSGSFSFVDNESGANDGKALKATSVYNANTSGAQIHFDHIDISKYESIIVRYKSPDTAGIYVNGDKCFVWGPQAQYATKDLASWALAQGITHLDTLEIGIRTTAGKTTYIDEIIFTPKAEFIDYEKATYQFSNYNDLGVTQSYNGGKFTLKADPLAKDGWALWTSTSGAKVLFDNIDVSKYKSITVRWRSTGSAGWANLYVNGEYWSATNKVNEYNELELVSHAVSKSLAFTQLNSLAFSNNNACEVYIDSIVFVEKFKGDEIETAYDFNETADLSVVESYNGGKFEVKADAIAKDGMALWTSTSGAKVLFDNVDVSKYESITVRWRSTGSAGWANLYVNGEYWSATNKVNEYNELELISHATTKGWSFTQLNSLTFNNNNSCEVYIDSIVFVEKLTEEVVEIPYDFDKESDLSVVESYNGGSFEVKADAIAKDGMALWTSTSGAKVLFDNIDVSKYKSITVRWRSTGSAGWANLCVNGDYWSATNKVSEYNELELISHAATKEYTFTQLSSLTFYNNNACEIYIDGIVFVEKSTEEVVETPYDFDKEADLSVVASYGGGTFSVIDDTKATDGKALKGTAPANADQRGIRITFDNLKINQYESIKVRWKTAGKWANVYINGDYNTLVTSSNSTEYDELDLVKLIAEKNLGVTELSSLDFVKNEWNYPVVYVDQITFVLKFPTYATLSDPQNEGLELAFFGAPSLATKDAFQQLKNTGAKTVYLNTWAGYALESDKLKTALEICDELGLNAYYHVNRNGFDSSSWDTDAANIITTATDYTQFPAFKGFYAWDEPNIDNMKELIQTELQEWNASKYKDKHYLVNLCGTTTKTNWWGSETQVDTTTVLTNSWNYVLKDNPNKVLLYDRYPFRVSGSDANNLFMSNKVLKEIEEFASFAKDKRDAGYDVKLHTFIQTFGDNANPEAEQLNRSLSSVREVRFNCAYNMVYGAKGLVAFTYERQAQFPTGMIEPSGAKNDSYYYVKKVFNELRQWEHVYSAFDWKGTITLDGTATGAGVQDASHITQLTKSLKVEDVERISSIETQHDLLVGTFKDNNGYDGFMVTSYVDPYYKNANNVKIKFNQASKALVYYNGTLLTNDDADTAYLLEDGVFNMTLDEGDYVFIIPVK